MGIRVLSYNIRSLRDDPAAVARVIAACRADVVCLQEAPRFAFWRGRRRVLAHRTGLVPVVNRRAGGLAILCRPGVRVLATGHRLLRRYPGLHLRAVSLVVLESPEPGGGPLTVACTHLDLEERARLQHAGEVVAHLRGMAAEHAAPPVLAGDINCAPDGAAWRLLAGELCDAGAERPLGEPFTFTARRPRVRIDGIFTGPELTVLGAGVPVARIAAADLASASDHRPVLAEVARR
ncbi:MAG: endonuclease/exonuclease/phosphatase family protein [Nocardiopsaceae bacterium]|nr:endonuclease/exonuclease/phosphatase family protein [Nocardiopsaceae bacterium]